MAGDVQQELAILPAKMEYQGVGIRFVSLLLDNIIIIIIIGMIGAIVGISMMMLGIIPWWWGLVYFMIYIGHFTVLERHSGQTIGNMIMRIKLVREEDGGKINMERSFKRNIF